jgi:hypothetical protein
VCVREKNDGEMQRWGRGEREQEWDGRRREREGAGGDARTVRRSNTCGELKERERRERGEIWSEDGREMDEREMEEERKNREREEWGRIINCYFYVYVCNQESESPEGKIKHFDIKRKPYYPSNFKEKNFKMKTKISKFINTYLYHYELQKCVHSSMNLFSMNFPSKNHLKFVLIDQQSLLILLEIL